MHFTIPSLRSLLLSSAALLGLCTTLGVAQQSAGTSDPTFNPADDGRFGDGSGVNDTVHAVAQQGDGKILVGGEFRAINGSTQPRLARLNQDGSVDTSFQTGVGLNGGGAGTYGVTALATQADGRVLVGGVGITSYNGTPVGNLLRLNSDGTLDPSFNPNPLGGGVRGISVQADGKLVVAGSFTSINGTARNRIARLHPDGSIDSSFIYATGANNSIAALAVQPDGKILLGGAFTTFDGSVVNRIVRLNATGGIDTGFLAGTGLGASSQVSSIAVQADGRVIASGSFTTWNGVARRCMARLNANGTLDLSYDPSPDQEATAMLVQSDGKLIAVGRFATIAGATRARVARLHADGSIDSVFDVGTGANNLVNTAILQMDGKLLIGGYHTTYRGTAPAYLTRIQPTGALDQTWGFSPGANGPVSVIAMQPDGKAIIGGTFTSYGSAACNRIARLLANGTVDPAFQTGSGAYGGPASPVVSALAVQPDGGIVVGGDFNRFNGAVANRLVRLMPDGSLDVAFNLAVGSGSGAQIRCIVIQPDGKLLVGGNFASFAGFAIGRIVRLNPDGTRDTTFAPGTAANGAVRCITLQPDGKILIGGEFTSYSGVAVPCMARLEPNGILDPTFVQGSTTTTDTGVAYVSSIVMQADGRLVVGGEFTIFAGFFSNRLARLNTDGSFILPTTNPQPFYFNRAITCMAQQPDGKLLVGGQFFDGGRNRLVRLHADGTVDLGLNYVLGPNDNVSCIQLQPDGKALIGGSFLNYDLIPRSRLARIYNQAGSDFTMSPYCFGDGAVQCPCANLGAGAGCGNSANPNGARLTGGGNPVLSNDTLTLTGSGMPNSAALYFQGSQTVAGGLGMPYGDGLLCVTGAIRRLGAKPNVAGSSSYPASGDPSVSVRGGITAPGTFHYQAWYRNAAAYCTASTFNLTNGLTVVWTP